MLALPRSIALLLLAAALLTLLVRFGAAPAAETGTTQAFDATRQILFRAQAGDGAVHVLNLRHTITEIATLRTPERRQVRALSLDASGRWLWVLGEHAEYRYDAQSLKPAGVYPLTAARMPAELALASASGVAAPR